MTTKPFDIEVGGFTFKFTPGVAQQKTTHYLSVWKGSSRLTPKRTAAFINLRTGKFNPLVINDQRYMIELIAVVSEYFGSINTIRYVPPGKNVRDFRDIKNAPKVWKRNP